MAPKVLDHKSTSSWTTPKGLVTIASFFALALISEFIIVSFFAGSGLTEVISFLPISPLFHLLPLSMIFVLVLSWMYLTEHVTRKPYRKVSSKITKTYRRSSRRRTKPTRGFVNAIKNFFSKIRAIFPHSSNISVMPRSLTFSRIAFESAITVLAIFLLSIILLSILANPRLLPDFAVKFYSTKSPFQGFMQSLASNLVPIASGLNSIASGFSKIFDGFISTQSLTGGDLLVRYVFCQIAALLVSAISVLAYVRFSTKIYQSNK
jgi:hypothetical protein